MGRKSVKWNEKPFEYSLLDLNLIKKRICGKRAKLKKIRKYFQPPQTKFLSLYLCSIGGGGGSLRHAGGAESKTRQTRLFTINFRCY